MIVKYSDFNKLYVLNKIYFENRVSKIYGNPLLSDLSNTMIKSIQGNCKIKDSQLICLSDYHIDKNQKYIRSNIINEILFYKKERDIVFLVEGTHAGATPNEHVHGTLIGNDLINCDYHCFGWDNMKLNNKSLMLIKEIQKLNVELKDKNAKYISLKENKQRMINNIQIDNFEDQFSSIETIESDIKELFLSYKKIQYNINSNYQKILDLSEDRNEYLYKSINKILEIKQNALIFVIGGEFHFNNIPQIFQKINYNIIRLKECVKDTNVEDVLTQVYGEVNIEENF